jgi:hypothetical protein
MTPNPDGEDVSSPGESVRPGDAHPLEDGESSGHEVDSSQIADLQANVDDASVDALAERLASDDPDERAGAAWRLVEAASSRPTKVRTVLDDVVAVTEDPDVWVRRGATWVLAELAEQQPDALSVKFSDLVDVTKADDALVRQNGVVAVAGVTKAYPARASSGLSAIAPLTQSDDPLLQRYAREAVEEVTRAIAQRAEDAGYPTLIRSHPVYEDLFPEGVGIVTVNEDDDREHAIHVSFGQDAPIQGGDAEGPQRNSPDGIPAPPNVSLSEADIEPNLELRNGTLTTDYRAQVDERRMQHGLVTLRRLHTHDPGVVEAFTDAVDQWTAIDDHDHVVTVLGESETWLATRYDDAETLGRRGSPQTLSEAFWVLVSATRAVSHAHARGVVHGGIHPEVIRYVETAMGQWDAPLVADWGFAHAASAVETPPVPHQYAAPEHRDPETYGRFDQATDVFGLGALAYRLLTGESPAIGHDGVRASERNPELPERIDTLFDLALAERKQSRYDTVLDFQRALEDVATPFLQTGGESR